MIDQPAQADGIIREGRADMVALGRALLADPRWPWRAAASARPRVPCRTPTGALGGADEAVGDCFLTFGYGWRRDLIPLDQDAAPRT